MYLKSGVFSIARTMQRQNYGKLFFSEEGKALRSLVLQKGLLRLLSLWHEITSNQCSTFRMTNNYKSQIA